MDVLKDFQRLKQVVESARRERDRAQGALAEALQELERLHECKSLEEAEQLFQSVDKKLSKQLKRVEEKTRELQTEFPDVIH